MPIVTGDLEWRFSGGAANADPQASLGGVMSSVELTSGLLHGLFDLVSGAENAAEEDEYRCAYLLNTHATLDWLGASVFIETEVGGGANIAIGLDLAGPGDGSSTGVADTVADEKTAPDPAVTFVSPTTEETGLDLGDLGPGEAHAIWFRRHTNDTGPVNNDGATIRAIGDTAA